MEQITDNNPQQNKEKKDSELWWQGVLENSLIGIMIYKSIRNENGKITDFEFLFANQMAENSVNRSNLAGKRLLEEFPGSITSGIFSKFIQVVESGNPWEDEIQYKDTKEKFWVSLKASKLNDGCLVFASDINERKKNEKDLISSNKKLARQAVDKYHALFNSIDQGYCTIEVAFDENKKAVDYCFLEVSPSFEQQTGIKDGAGKWMRDIAPEQDEFWFEMYGSVALNRKPERFEYHSTPLKRWWSVYAFPTDKPELKHVGVLFNDITGRKKAEEKLRGSEEKYRQRLEKEVQERTSELTESKHFIQLITDSTPDLLYVYDVKEWKIIYVNNGINKILGYKPEDTYASGRKDFENMLHPDDLQKRISEMENLVFIKPGEVRETEFRVSDTKGNFHWLSVRDTFFKAGEDGLTKQVLSICQDITEKKEVIEAYREEKIRSEELLRMNEMMDTFVFAAAHDLKAPISNLKMLTGVIDNTDDTDRKLLLQKKYSSVIKTLDNTISGLIKVLAVEKDFSSGTKMLHFQDVYDVVAEELSQQIKSFDPEINIDFSICNSIVYIESYLFSIFRTILSNALNYRSDERKLIIDIRSGCTNRYIWLQITDNGTGIDLDYYGKDLFKPFKRFVATPEGIGLGLHLVKSIVTKNGGKIKVESKKGKGTTFKIYMVEYNK
jgi:PAS domain S-box-containing protein